MGIRTMGTMLRRGPGGCTAHIKRNAADSLRDRNAKARIDARIRGARVLLLLCGGDKRSQHTDIVRAREISKDRT